MAQQTDIRISAIVKKKKKKFLRILEQNVKTNITKIQTQVQNKIRSKDREPLFWKRNQGC